MDVAMPSALSANVLVLNKHYAALRVVSARRALCMLFRRVAEIVSVDDGSYEGHDFESWQAVSLLRARHERDSHEWVRCVRFEIAVPRVLRLLTYDRIPITPVRLTRRNVYARDRNHCQYCGRKFPTPELTLDHIVPRSQGGGMTWENIVCCCVKCNARKGGRTPQRAHMKLITEPIKPKRSPAVTIHLSSKRYASWKQFLNAAYWNVELRD